MPLPLTSQLIALDTTHASDGTATVLRLVAISADGGCESVLPLAPRGAMLDVAMGYDTALQSVFAGTVRGQRLRLSDAGVPELELHATSAVRPGALIDLRGVGDAFGGQHRIVGVQQVFSKAGWRTVVDVADTASSTD